MSTVARLVFPPAPDGTFVAHGVIPVPAPGWQPPANRFGDPPRYAFRAVVEGRELVTQIEGVMKLADGAYGTIEVLARVPMGLVSPGQPFELELRQQDHVAENPFPGLHPRVYWLLAAEGNAGVRWHDGAGRAYRAGITGVAAEGPRQLSFHRVGPVAITARRSTWCELDRSTGTSNAVPPLAHGGAVTTWATVTSEPTVQLDLRWSNGVLPAVGDLYFDALELLVPSGWEVAGVLEDPAVDTAMADDGTGMQRCQLVTQLPDGKLNLLPRRFERFWPLRLREGAHPAPDMVLGVCRPGTGLWSWQNPETARWQPQHALLPDLSPVPRLEDKLAAEAELELQRFRDGLPSPPSGGAPAAHFLQFRAGVYGGWTSGYDVEPLGRPELVWHCGRRELEARLVEFIRYSSRQRFIRGSGGGASRPEDYLEEGGTRGWQLFSERFKDGQDAPFGFEAAGDGNRLAGAEPPYKDALVGADGAQPWERGVEPIDDQHRVRCDEPAQWLAFAANHPVAREYLLSRAEVVRMALWDGVDGELTAALQRVAGRLHWGETVGRETAWQLNVAVAAYTLADSWDRERWLDWIRGVADLLVGCQMPNGLYSRKDGGKVVKDPPFKNPPEHAATRPNEEAFLSFALRGALASVFLGEDPERVDLIRDSLDLHAEGMWDFAWKRLPERAPATMERVPVAPINGPPFDGPEDQPAEILERLAVDDYQTWLELTTGIGAGAVVPMVEALREVLGVADFEEMAAEVARRLGEDRDVGRLVLGSRAEVYAVLQAVMGVS